MVATGDSCISVLLSTPQVLSYDKFEEIYFGKLCSQIDGVGNAIGSFFDQRDFDDVIFKATISIYGEKQFSSEMSQDEKKALKEEACANVKAELTKRIAKYDLAKAKIKSDIAPIWKNMLENTHSIIIRYHSFYYIYKIILEKCSKHLGVVSKHLLSLDRSIKRLVSHKANVEQEKPKASAEKAEKELTPLVEKAEEELKALIAEFVRRDRFKTSDFNCLQDKYSDLLSDEEKPRYWEVMAMFAPLYDKDILAKAKSICTQVEKCLQSTATERNRVEEIISYDAANVRKLISEWEPKIRKCEKYVGAYEAKLMRRLRRTRKYL